MTGIIFGRFDPLYRFGMPVALALSAVLVLARIFLAIPFWNSGWTKWSEFPFSLNASAKYLFSLEYKLHIFGHAFPMPVPELMAWLSGLGEVILPVLLVAGLFSRFAALGLACMIAVIQLVYPDAWLLHGRWALAAGCIIIAGPGMISLDAGICRMFKSKE